ncbi:flagellar hook protein FlgE [Andreprevotia lacus DSM 23236]|jgi:flagellar hook protein FlgE|uniref:Flagellar hook protein FlgE n=1 Tax=Andreprevotia lacus DSM 23236 TaxID=1121001 RepID=A0A1W1WYR4_9NEIS|nr:flagellar hook protein FlgE [Andreprevotia lacus]SMC16805.1 flagellar hook protein FlgE [Andreprevotia lacus DSM 23236]
MGFQQGLSGLNASSKNLDVIGNNIANSSTVGFKNSRTEFADIYASSFASSSTIAGIGVRVTDIAQQFSQGNITTTNNALDVAITGNGFFRVQDPAGNISYTRNGQFQVDRNGYINNNGQYLTGWTTDPNSGLLIKGGQPKPIQLTVGNIGARATGGSGTSNAGLQLVLNLDASKPILDRTAPPTGVGPLSITDPTTYTNSTSATVYDAQGVSHTLTYYFSKVGVNKWEVQTSFDGAAPVPADPTQTLGTAPNAPATQGYMYFDGNGRLTGPASTPPAPADAIPSFNFATTLVAPNGATSPFTFNVNFAKSTQFGSAFGVNSINQDGYADGRLTGLSIAKDGTIQGNYSNSQTKVVGQLVLANFTNVQGLQPLGDNRWAQSFASGEPRVGDPGTTDLGLLQSAALEDSNVDLTGELVNLITAQRNYQANAQTIKAQDQILQTLVSLR